VASIRSCKYTVPLLELNAFTCKGHHVRQQFVAQADRYPTYKHGEAVQIDGVFGALRLAKPNGYCSGDDTTASNKHYDYVVNQARSDASRS
jgi:hypothetical protein